MRSISEELAAHLAGGVTTLCHGWTLKRRDGVVMGFTDHDGRLEFDGVAFEPEAGFEASEIVSSIGLAVDNLDVSGALSSDRLTSEDLEAGLYDDAEVAIWLINWQAPDQRLRVATGSIGEVRREDGAFTAEIRGLAHRLDQEKGRIFQFGCDAELGDARCGVELDQAGLTVEGSIGVALGDRRFRADGLDGATPGWFAAGSLQWTSGANAGRRMQVRGHVVDADGIVIELWREPRFDIVAGDTFLIRAGCDKQFGTCRTKFDNHLNFRGFPHMPGNDFAIGYAPIR